MDESPTNPHYHTLDGCTFIYTYIQNTQIIVAQFLHMGELTPQQLTKSLKIFARLISVLKADFLHASNPYLRKTPQGSIFNLPL